MDLLLLDIDEPKRLVASTISDLRRAPLRDSRRYAARLSSPARIDEIFVAGDQPRVVRCKEQHHCRNVARGQAGPSGIARRRSRPRLRRVPFHLPWRPDVAWNNTVDADIVWTRGRAQATASVLRSQPCRSDRAQARGRARCQLIEPRLTIAPPPLLPHSRDHRLGAKEIVLEVHVETVVPIVLGHFVDVVAIVICGIVDQHVERARLGRQGRECAA